MADRKDPTEHPNDQSMEANTSDSLDAGLAAGFGAGGNSVLGVLGQTMDQVPRVVLKESPAEAADPIVRPNSAELPKTEAGGRYRLDGEIARGGMGAIVKGRDTDLGRDLAVKVLLGEHRDRPEIVQRFIEEAQIGGQLQHPGIVPVYELGTFPDGRPFFTMKLVKGSTLSALLADRESPREDRAKFLGIFEQICQTLAYAHSRGVIHRDLKPANIMVGAFGEVQVMDWGLAKVLAEGGVADEKRTRHKMQEVSIIQTIRSHGSDAPVGGIGTASTGSDTQMGSVMGTPAYMPPEQALGEIDRLDERSDVFGLGAILVEILTGAPPYIGTETTEIYRQSTRGKLDDCFTRLSESGVDETLLQIVRRCLSLEPAGRPRNAGALAESISGYIESVEQRLHDAELESVEANTRAVEERKRRRVMLALAASTLLTFAVGGGGWLWVREKDAAMQRTAMVRQHQLEHQIRGELSTAAALAGFGGTEFPDRPSLERALEAADRAAGFLDVELSQSEIANEVSDLLDRLTSMKRDLDLVKGLESAWETEMEERSLRGRQSPSGGAGRATNAAAQYERAFTQWGLVPGSTSQADAIARIGEMDDAHRPAVLVSLDRWQNRMRKSPTLASWLTRQWTTLEPVDLKSRGGDSLTVQPDGSILAHGINQNAGYDLTFETDQATISALRLEALLDDSLPNKGPGRGSERGGEGIFHLRGLSISVTPRGSVETPVPLTFRDAVSDSSHDMLPTSPQQWANDVGGAPRTAVFDCERPVTSESGFTIQISNENCFYDQSLGRFRWSVNSQPRRDADVDWLGRLVAEIDQDPWRTSRRSEMEQEDYRSLFERASELNKLSEQPKMLLIELAEALRGASGNELAELIGDSVNWETLRPESIVVDPGVVHEIDDEGTILLKGNTPKRESVLLTAAVGERPITAVRIEALPTTHSSWGVPFLGRGPKLTVSIAEIDISSVVTDDQPSSETPIPIRHAFANFDRPYSLSKALDDDLSTYLSLANPEHPRTLTLMTEPSASGGQSSLRIRIDTANSQGLGRFKISVSHDDLTIFDPEAVAAKILKNVQHKHPSDYWVHLALADTLRHSVPARHDDALRHAAIAVALRPDDAGGYAAVLRSLPLDGIDAASPMGELVIAHLDRLRELEPNHGSIDELVSRLIEHADQLSSREGDTEATAVYELALQLSSPSAVTYRRLANKFYGRSSLGISSAAKAVEVEPHNSLNHLALADNYWQVGNHRKSIEAFRNAVKVDPNRAEVHGRLGRALYDLGAMEQKPKESEASKESEDVLRHAVELDPTKFFSHSSLGIALHRGLGKLAEAEQCYRKAIEIDPLRSVWPRRNLFWLLNGQGRHEESIEVLVAATELDPRDFVGYRGFDLATANAYNTLAATLDIVGLQDKAIPAAERALQLDPGHSIARRLLASILTKTGRIEEARRVYEDRLRADPGDAFTRMHYAEFLANELDDPAAAIEIYRSTIKFRTALPEVNGIHKRSYSDSYDSLADLLRKREDFDGVIDAYLQAIARFPSGNNYYRWLAEVAVTQDRLDEFIPIYETAVETQPGNVHVLYAVAWAMVEYPAALSPDRTKWALELARRANRLNPNHDYALQALGVALYRSGSWPEAQDALQRSRAKSETGDWLTELLRARRAHALAFESMAAFRQNHLEEAKSLLRLAERELGVQAFRPPDPQVDGLHLERLAYRALTEARQLLGESVEFSDKERNERIELALEEARRVVKSTDPVLDEWRHVSRSWSIWSKLAIHHYRQRGWSGAAQEARLAIELADGDVNLLLNMAPLLLLAGEQEEYRKLCRTLLEEPDYTGPTSRAELGGKRTIQEEYALRHLMLCSHDDTGIDPNRLHPEHQGRGSHVMLARGRVQMWAGDYEQAIVTLRDGHGSASRNGLITGKLSLAIAYQRSGQSAKARQWLDRAARLLVKKDGAQSAKMLIPVLYEEANRLIPGHLPEYQNDGVMRHRTESE